MEQPLYQTTFNVQVNRKEHASVLDLCSFLIRSLNCFKGREKLTFIHQYSGNDALDPRNTISSRNKFLIIRTSLSSILKSKFNMKSHEISKMVSLVYKLLGGRYLFYLQYLSTIEGTNRENPKVDKKKRRSDISYLESCKSTYKLRKENTNKPQNTKFRVGKKKLTVRKVYPPSLGLRIRPFNYGILTEDMIAITPSENDKQNENFPN